MLAGYSKNLVAPRQYILTKTDYYYNKYKTLNATLNH
ncbi:hypothetical protein SPYJRS4_1784 [Streptococcus pyogenes JRS4]|uniref:Uncharacterized protein n=1 Tax=Streptococcus pyogenes serotype M12 (strain MGAS9429) TaxID=370551 RepID=Q1JJL1_STRPC|nr:hypothetical protein MGAS9429_Spy1775 [Streptococcus pyogenes MGAS9429]BAR45284.1 hypothetical protein SPYJRS4_1784 [Streptococcus pyogenes JRS4]